MEAAPAAGISALTLYAFSSDNWKRPAEEVSALMSLFEIPANEIAECVAKDVGISFIGRRDRLSRHIVSLMAKRRTTLAMRAPTYPNRRRLLVAGCAGRAATTSWTERTRGTNRGSTARA